MELTDKQLDDLMKRADADGSGAISFIEFAKLMITYEEETSLPDPSVEFKSAF